LAQNQDIITSYPLQILQQQNQGNNLINGHNNKQILVIVIIYTFLFLF